MFEFLKKKKTPTAEIKASYYKQIGKTVIEANGTGDEKAELIANAIVSIANAHEVPESFVLLKVITAVENFSKTKEIECHLEKTK